MKIRFFGELNLRKSQYDTIVHLQDRDIILDLNLENVLGTRNWIISYDNYVSKISNFRKEIEREIHENYKEKGIVKEWIDYHIEELKFKDEELDDLLEVKFKNCSLENKLFSLLNLSRIGLYPGDEDYTVWDFTLDGELSDEILVVITDIDGDLIDFAWETEGE